MRAKIGKCWVCDAALTIVNGRVESDPGVKVLLLFPREGGDPTAVAHKAECSELPPGEWFTESATAEELSHG